MNLYLTADRIAINSGGGSRVPYEESEAFKTLGDCCVWDITQIDCAGKEPWKWDDHVLDMVQVHRHRGTDFKLCHTYAGTFSKTVHWLKEHGCKTSFTCAAHDKEESRQEHINCGMDYDARYPHMVVPELWQKYVAGYLEADVLIVPSTYSESIMRKYGRTGPIRIVPHGCDIPKT